MGFRDDRYWSAVRVFGRPDFIHPDWDGYAAGDVAPGDTVVHAIGSGQQPPRSFSAEAAANRAARGKEPRLPALVSSAEGDTHDR